MSRLEAYAMLTHHALNDIFYSYNDENDGDGCCPQCCAPCEALQHLDNEGILDEVIKNWDTYSDGTSVLKEGNPSWWVNGKVDREWLYAAWKKGEWECHNNE